MNKESTSWLLTYFFLYFDFFIRLVSDIDQHVVLSSFYLIDIIHYNTFGNHYLALFFFIIIFIVIILFIAWVLYCWKLLFVSFLFVRMFLRFFLSFFIFTSKFHCFRPRYLSLFGAYSNHIFRWKCGFLSNLALPPFFSFILG